MKSSLVSTTHFGKIAVVAINRPESLNTLSVETLKLLTVQLKELSQQSYISAVVIGGVGQAFAAGADINELLTLDSQKAVAFSELGKRLFDQIRSCPQIVIAAIDGYCMGGGLDLALSCDLRYGSSTTVLAHPGAKIGIVTGFGGTRRLPLATSLSFSNQLFATATRIGAEEALKSRLIQDFNRSGTAVELAMAKAELIAQKSLKQIEKLKKVVYLVGETVGGCTVASRYLDLCKKAATDNPH
ncbi:MAG: enoyl-CoA hydratase/isomerase family protein [Blastocatellia bacterium]|nr:enoyl-CoA hydratase/isomerase family protein [Blastocatellia bacterium]